jgi:hypothetical protein
MYRIARQVIATGIITGILRGAVRNRAEFPQ